MNIARIIDAIQFSEKCHRGQKRDDGEPYIIHPLAVAKAVSIKLRVNDVSDGISEACVIAAVLHDVVEDCDIDLGDVRKLYGNDVASFVDQLTRYSGESYDQYIDELLEKGSPALLIKEADIEHNCSQASTDRFIEKSIKALKKIKERKKELGIL